MKVTIHGAAMDIDISGETMGELFDKIETQGYIVYQVFADGKDISNISESDFEKLGVIEHLEIVVKELKELTLETLKEVDEFIPEYIERIEKFLAKIHEGSETARFIMLQQLVDTLQWFTSLLENIDFQEENVEKNKFFMKWSETIEGLLAAVESKDLVLTADVLEYELIPVLKEYQEYIRVANKKII